jgi:protein-S-isoprenylcysteine O-methyltransferase Ste14
MSLQDRLVGLRPPRIAMALVAAAASLHLLFPLAILQPSWTGGLLLGSAGFAIMLRAWWLFRRVATPICPTDHATTLLTDDVYRFTRNPMYLGMIMIVLGIAVAVGTAPFYAAAVALFGILNFVFCPFEERRLRAAFPGFDAYAAGVRRWI